MVQEENKLKKILQRALFILVLIVLILTLGSLRTIYSKNLSAKNLAVSNKALDKTYVKTIKAESVVGMQTLELPGTLQGYTESPIYARTNGYILHWYKDIGEKVKKGELLAKIDTPEIDKSLSLVMATRQQKKGALELAESSYARWQLMRSKDVVSQQELEEKKSNLIQAQADFSSAEADVERLNYLVNYKKVISPFNGIVTQRNIDIGDLVSNSDSLSKKPMFLISQVNPLRVFVDVPQSYANNIHINQPVTISQKEIHGQIFNAKIANTAGAIDKTTRTLQIEIILPNDDNQLLPGSFVKVSVPIESKDSLKVPLNAMLFKALGPSVATVVNNKVKIKYVTIGQDFGNRLEIIQGLDASDEIILNPPDSIADGDSVEISN
jgi:RND family efflux transporter MFP subunit